MRPYLEALRIKTLPAAVVPVVFAAGLLLRRQREIPWGLFAFTVASALCIQIATNFFNDALDADRGADGPDRLGPVRATGSGQLTRRAVMTAGVGFIVLAALLAVPLIVARGWLVVAIGVPSVFLAFGYTGGGLRLAYRGLGELFVLIFFGWVAVLGSVFVLGGRVDGNAWALGTACGGFSCVLIAINNLRDHRGDRRVGKMTLAARFGPAVGRPVILVSTLLGYGGIGWVEWQNGQLSRLPWYLLPLMPGLLILYGVFTREPGRHFNRYLALGGVQLILSALVFAL